MIIVDLIGGLGNQLFQYATGYALSRRSGTALRLDPSAFLHYRLHRYRLPLLAILGTEASVNERTETAFHGILLEETSLGFDERLLAPHENAIVRGYWQSERYFRQYRSELLDQIVPAILPDDGDTREIKRRMAEGVAISVHIRRGDYVSNPHATAVHGVLPLDYYRRADEKMRSILGIGDDEVRYVVFSDDPDWAAENVSLSGATVFVRSRGADDDSRDMHLMSLAQHHIVANSSFSWWGAWLCRNAGQIAIAPARWFAKADMDSGTIVPDRWLRL